MTEDSTPEDKRPLSERLRAAGNGEAYQLHWLSEAANEIDRLYVSLKMIVAGAPDKWSRSFAASRLPGRLTCPGCGKRVPDQCDWCSEERPEKFFNDLQRRHMETVERNADLLTEIEGLRHENADLHEQVAALQSREVCTVAHDDVEVCGYCQRDALQLYRREVTSLLEDWLTAWTWALDERNVVRRTQEFLHGPIDEQE